MKPQFKQIVTIILSAFLLSCNSDETNPENAPINAYPKIPLASQI